MVKKISKKYLFDRGEFIPSRLYKLLKEMYDDIQELKGDTPTPTPTTTDIAVSVKDGEDTAVEGASVVLTDSTDDTKTFTCTTGSAGGCNITSVPEGTYVVTATATGYENYTGSEPLVVTSETTTLAVVMTAS